jgi:hypothetical protein
VPFPVKGSHPVVLSTSFDGGGLARRFISVGRSNFFECTSCRDKHRCGHIKHFKQWYEANEDAWLEDRYQFYSGTESPAEQRAQGAVSTTKIPILLSGPSLQASRQRDKCEGGLLQQCVPREGPCPQCTSPLGPPLRTCTGKLTVSRYFTKEIEVFHRDCTNTNCAHRCFYDGLDDGVLN